jgi:hypothetical protein
MNNATANFIYRSKTLLPFIGETDREGEKGTMVQLLFTTLQGLLFFGTMRLLKMRLPFKPIWFERQ